MGSIGFGIGQWRRYGTEMIAVAVFCELKWLTVQGRVSLVPEDQWLMEISYVPAFL